MENTKFQSIKNRVMTPAEAREKCVELKVSDVVTEMVVKEFDNLQFEDDDRVEDKTGTEGRIAFGQSWEYARDDLAVAMDLSDNPDDRSEDQETQLMKVYDAFFEE